MRVAPKREGATPGSLFPEKSSPASHTITELCQNIGIHEGCRKEWRRVNLHPALQTVMAGIPTISKDRLAVNFCFLNDLIPYVLQKACQVVIHIQRWNSPSESSFEPDGSLG